VTLLIDDRTVERALSELDVTAAVQAAHRALAGGRASTVGPR